MLRPTTDWFCRVLRTVMIFKLHRCLLNSFTTSWKLRSYQGVGSKCTADPPKKSIHSEIHIWAPILLHTDVKVPFYQCEARFLFRLFSLRCLSLSLVRIVGSPVHRVRVVSNQRKWYVNEHDGTKLGLNYFLVIYL